MARSRHQLKERNIDDLVAFLPGVMDKGGMIEMSEWGGQGALWTRAVLRRGGKVTPSTVEGIWYGVGVVNALATRELILGMNDAKVQKAARALAKELDRVLDLYDS